MTATPHRNAGGTIAVLVDGSSTTAEEILEGAELASGRGALLEVVGTIYSNPWAWGAVALGGLTIHQLTHELEVELQAQLRGAVAELPRDVCVRTRIVRGKIATVARKYRESGDYAVVLVGGSGTVKDRPRRIKV